MHPCKELPQDNKLPLTESQQQVFDKLIYLVSLSVILTLTCDLENVPHVLRDLPELNQPLSHLPSKAVAAVTAQ